MLQAQVLAAETTSAPARSRHIPMLTRRYDIYPARHAPREM